MNSSEIVYDLKGREVLKYTFPGVRTKLVINGNEFQITKIHNKGQKIIAEFIGRHDAASQNS